MSVSRTTTLNVDAVVEALDQGVLAVGVGVDKGGRQGGQAVDAGDAQGAATAGRLHDDARAEAVHDVLHQRGGADVAEGLGGEADAVRDRDAVPAEQLTRGALVVGHPAGVAAGADVGQTDELEQRLDLAVLAELAVQRRERRDHLVALEGAAAAGGRSRRLRVDAQPPQLAHQVATAGQRDVALVAQTARDDRDGPGAPRWSKPRRRPGPGRRRARTVGARTLRCGRRGRSACG